MLLSSLGKWNQLRVNETANIVPRKDGQVLDVLRNYSNEEEDGSAQDIAFCHIASLFPLNNTNTDNPNSTGFHLFGYEAAIATALAINHLNEGDGTLVREVDGLNERCNIRFTTEYIDTKFDPGHTMKQIAQLTEVTSTRLPSAFLGAFRSAVSGPSSIITGLQGYPQISGASTSAALDDKDQHPKFARTIPSDNGVTEAIIEYLHVTLGLDHVVVMHVNDSFGNSYAQGLRNAAGRLAPEMNIIQISVDQHQTEESIKQAIVSLKQTRFNFVFCIVLSAWYDDIMIEASRMGVAGNGEHNWLFADLFAKHLINREFEQGSVLHKAYRGTGILRSSARAKSKFQAFSASVLALKNDTDDFDYLKTILPYFDKTPFFDSESFLDPIGYDYTMFFYDAVILTGLAACDAAGKDLMMTGDTFYDRIVNYPAFEGVSGNVVLNPITGTRESYSAYYTLTNFVDEERLDQETGKIMVEFKGITTDQYFNGTWTPIVNYTFNDGTFNPPLGIPLPITDENFIQPWIRAITCTFCVGAIILSIGFALWTWHYRRTRVVMASQPFFLLLICLGCFVMASAIIPIQIDHQIADVDGCTIACNAIIWQVSLGFAIVFSSIGSKTHRINVVMQNAARCSRIKVTVRDTIKPVVVFTSLNIIALSLMTALDPLTYEIDIVKVDEYDQPLEIYPHCARNGSFRYLIPLSLLNMACVIAAIIEAWKARNIATEFAESKYIFKALISILFVVCMGGPIMFIATDNPNASVFVKSGIIFVAVCAILLLMFVPKILFHRDRQIEKKRKTKAKNGNWTGNSGSSAVNNSLVSNSVTDPRSHCDESGKFSGEKILTTKTRRELVEEVKLLKIMLMRATTDKITPQCTFCSGETDPLKESDSCKGKGSNNWDGGDALEGDQVSDSDLKNDVPRSLGEGKSKSIGSYKSIRDEGKDEDD